MAKLVDPGAREVPEVAGRLLAIAAEQELPVSCVQVTHEPGLMFSVPDSVAEAYEAEQEQASADKPKRQARAKAAETEKSDA